MSNKSTLSVTAEQVDAMTVKEIVDHFFFISDFREMHGLMVFPFSHEKFMGLMTAAVEANRQVTTSYIMRNPYLTTETIAAFASRFDVTVYPVMSLEMAINPNTPAEILVYLSELGSYPHEKDSGSSPALRISMARQNLSLPADYVNAEAERLLLVEVPDYNEDETTTESALYHVFSHEALSLELVDKAILSRNRIVVDKLAIHPDLTSVHVKKLHQLALQLDLVSAAECYALGIYESEADTTFKDWPFEWIENHLGVPGMNMESYYDKK